MALVIYALVGWIIPSEPWLMAHLIFIPGLITVWRMNDGACPLNNLETYLTMGVWRNRANAEEGAFLKTIVERYLNLTPTQALMDQITYGLMLTVWLLSLAHLTLFY